MAAYSKAFGALAGGLLAFAVGYGLISEVEAAELRESLQTAVVIVGPVLGSYLAPANR